MSTTPTHGPSDTKSRTPHLPGLPSGLLQPAGPPGGVPGTNGVDGLLPMPPLPSDFLPRRTLLRVRNLVPPYIPALDGGGDRYSDAMSLDGASEQGDWRAATCGLPLADFECRHGRLPGEGCCQ